MALDNYCLFPPMDWDLHTLGGAQEGVHETFPLCAMESPVSSEASSGYLQDAIVHCSDRRKRQRTAVSPPRHPAMVNEDIQHLLQNFWDFSAQGDLFHDLNVMIPERSIVSEDDASESVQLKGPIAAAQVPAPQAREETDPPSSSPPHLRRPLLPIMTDATHGMESRKYSQHPNKSSSHASSTSASCSSPRENQKKGIGVLYPFAVVKPLGLEGDMTTLDDINKRILKRPARPVRHPVGPFACSPSMSPHGLSISGKAIVSLTRISTGGKGTITITRTRG